MKNLLPHGNEIPAGSRRKVLVVEPHNDDAALSVGGTMWLQRHNCEFIIATVASRSNYTKYLSLNHNDMMRFYRTNPEFFGTEQVSALRNAEGAMFAHLIGGCHIQLGLPASSLRYEKDHIWSLDWHLNHRASIFAYSKHISDMQQWQDWASAIAKLVGDVFPAEIWIPLGAPHIDHELTRNACLIALMRDPSFIQQTTIRFYLDLPYVARYPNFTATTLKGFADLGVQLTHDSVSIADAFSEKRRLLSVYRSQFEMDEVTSELEQCGYPDSKNDTMREHFWRIEKLPPSLNFPARFPDKETIQHLNKHLLPWIKRNQHKSFIRILLAVPSGRWKEDVKLLLNIFPHAQLIMYLAPTALAESAYFTDARITVYPVKMGKCAWVMVAFRLMIMRPAPTLFFAGAKNIRKAKFLAKLWPLTDSLVMSAISEFAFKMKQCNPEPASL